MAPIDLVKWNAPDNIYAWKFPSEELSTWTQLVVAESQEAVVVYGGQMEGPFGPGRHTLSAENIPLITELTSLPFEGQSPFTAEVWYVNRAMPLDVRWGTPDPIQILDPKYKIMLPVRAFGQYGVKIDDTKKFLIKLVGTLPSFDQDQLSSYFRGLMVTLIKDVIATAIIDRRLSVLDISAHLSEISLELQHQMGVELAEFGLRVVNFYVNSINTPENDPAVEKLKTALAKRAEMDILGFTYHQERSFDALQTAAGNEGAAGTMMGAGLGMGLGVGVGTTFGNTMGNIAQQIQPLPSTTHQPQPSVSHDNADGAIKRIEALKELACLRKEGILTDDEFVVEKKRVLGSP